MNNHESVESLSAFIDDEVGDAERSRIMQHLESCDHCAGRHAALSATAVRVKTLPEIAPTPAESAQLRRRILESLPPLRVRKAAGWSRRGGTRPARANPGWAVAGIVGLIAVVAAGWAVLSPPSQSDLESASRASAPASFDFKTEEEVRDRIAAQEEVKRGAGLYTVSDVGGEQEDAINRVSGEEQTASRTEAGDQQAPEAGGTSALSARTCLELVLRRLPHPAMPLLARGATFRGETAWALAYAYTTQLAEDAPLDRVQVWVVKRSDCTTLHYSSFKV